MDDRRKHIKKYSLSHLCGWGPKLFEHISRQKHEHEINRKFTTKGGLPKPSLQKPLISIAINHVGRRQTDFFEER